MYVKLYKHRDQVVVIDDVDTLYADRSAIRLLKCLCQTEDCKGVAWQTDARSLERQGIPREFATTSRTIIICNDWKTLNRNVAALQDRGHVLTFEPTAAEVHRRAGEWFNDPEIYAYFQKNLHRVIEPSFRHYLRAGELKRAGMDWTDVLAEANDNPRARLAAEILGCTTFQSTKERVEAFVSRGGGSRATFFNYKRRLGSGGADRPASVSGKREGRRAEGPGHRRVGRHLHRRFSRKRPLDPGKEHPGSISAGSGSLKPTCGLVHFVAARSGTC